MSKKFSIIFPTRERVKLLEQLLISIVINASYREDIEILVAYDSDDEETKKYIHRAPSLIDIKFVECERSLNFSRDYYNRLAKMTTGKWIIVCNDDGKFETHGWDLGAERVLSSFIGDGPNIVYGWIEDKLGAFRLEEQGNYCCSPLIGRDGYEALGYVFPDRIPTWGADIWMAKIYNQINRVVKLPMTINHICHHNFTREQDPISKRIAENQIDPQTLGFNISPRYQEIVSLKTIIKEHSHAKKI